MVSEMESFSSEPETEHSFHHTEGSGDYKDTLLIFIDNKLNVNECSV